MISCRSYTPPPSLDLPRSVQKIEYYLQRECGVPSENLEWHGHNDFHKVHINSVTAWLSGVAAVNGAVMAGFQTIANITRQFKTLS